ncbi:MAG: PLDc N-terminal domain-containing protein [Promethearchaeota archaeon]
MIFTFPLDPFGALGFLLILPLILAGVWFVIAIIVAIWVYKDAKKRDMNAAVWLLIVLVTGCIGCIIYLVVRD